VPSKAFKGIGLVWGHPTLVISPTKKSRGRAGKVFQLRVNRRRWYCQHSHNKAEHEEETPLKQPRGDRRGMPDLDQKGSEESDIDDDPVLGAEGRRGGKLTGMRKFVRS